MYWDLYTTLRLSYQEAKRGKGDSQAVDAFRMHEETLLHKLYEELIHNTYQPSPSTFFVIHDPVQREICAAAFRDRIVHHLIHTYLSPLCDPRFIADSYGARCGKWTHYWVKKTLYFIRQCTANQTQSCWVMKLDVQAFFMSIDQSLLKRLVRQHLYTIPPKSYQHRTLPSHLWSRIQTIIDHNPTSNYHMRWSTIDRYGLPKGKSLFHIPPGKWLPLGNLTSQLFANIYLNPLDQYVKHVLKVKRYGRYMDDMVLVHQSKSVLLEYKQQIADFLKEHLLLTLHPNKSYLQPASKWVPFLWYRIFPRGNLLGKRTISRRRAKTHTWNTTPAPDIESIRSTSNSYLWMARHGKNQQLRKQMIQKLRPKISNALLSSWGYQKLVPRVRKVKKRDLRKY